MATRHGRRARQLHEHKAVIAHALRQHAGIPYEVEQHVCADCKRVLDELEKRVAKLERELAKQQPAGKSTTARKRTTPARKPAAAKKPSA